MIDNSFYLELIKNTGFPALIFIIWMVYHKAQSRSFESMIKNQSEREKRNFELLKEMLEANQTQSSALIRLENRIEAYKYCPYSHLLERQCQSKEP